MRATIDAFVTRAKSSDGLKEVARRYARNIANGRWLWRNRTIASTINIAVSKKSGEKITAFDAKHVPLNNFDNYLPEEEPVALELANQMKGESLDGLIIEAVITMRAQGNIEVFPSQNYVENKPRGFSRALYKVGHPDSVDLKNPNGFTDTRLTGYAALRDQKIFNAIRTIDTWYQAYAETNFPIPIEPLGANLGQQEFYRKGDKSSFTMFKNLENIDPDTDDGMFCIAALDRGGVYGESDKGGDKDKPKTNGGDLE